MPDDRKRRGQPSEPIASDFSIGSQVWSSPTDTHHPGWKKSLLIALVILAVFAVFFGVLHYWR